MDEEDYFYHVEGIDQAFVTEKSRRLLSSKLAPIVTHVLEIDIRIIDVRDIYGHAFHARSKKGYDKLLFNFTSRLKFSVSYNDHQVLAINLT